MHASRLRNALDIIASSSWTERSRSQRKIEVRTLLRQIIIYGSLEHTRRCLFNDSPAITAERGEPLVPAADVLLEDTRVLDSFPHTQTHTREKSAKSNAIERCRVYRELVTPRKLGIAAYSIRDSIFASSICVGCSEDPREAKEA